jgi:hypothetical protein
LIIHLSTIALANAKIAASLSHKKVQEHIQEMLESLLTGKSTYIEITISPVPDADRIKAIQVAINSIISAPFFYGFKMLSVDEYEEAVLAKQKQEAEKDVIELSKERLT